MLPGMIPPKHRKIRRAVEVAQLASLNATGAHTYNAVSLGEAAEDRIILVYTDGSGNSGGAYAVSGITVGGVAMTMTAGPSTRAGAAIGYLKVPAGVSANIVVTTTGANCNVGGYVVALYGFELDTPQYVYCSDAAAGGNATVSYAAVDWTTRDWVICFSGNAGGTLRTFTFSTKQSEFTGAEFNNWGIYKPTADAVAQVEQLTSGGGVWHAEAMIIWR